MGTRRLVASLIDLALTLNLALLLATTTGTYFARRAVVTLEIGSPTTLWQGPLPMVLGIFGEIVYGLPFAMLLVLLCETWLAASPGKLLCGLQVEAARGGSPTTARLIDRTVIKCSGLWVLTVSLIAGNWPLAALAALLLAFVLGDFATALVTGRAPLYDRIASTTVTRRQPLDGDARQGVFVPEAGLEPAHPFRDRGF